MQKTISVTPSSVLMPCVKVPISFNLFKTVSLFQSKKGGNNIENVEYNGHLHYIYQKKNQEIFLLFQQKFKKKWEKKECLFEI